MSDAPHGTCQAANCACGATHALRLSVPAKGYARDAHTPITMVVDIRLCERHARAAQPRDLITKKLKENTKDLLKALRYAPPDFDRAWVDLIELGGIEYAEYQRTVGAGGKS